MATLVREFLLGVTTLLQDNPQGRRWGEQELVRYTNFGQRALAKYLPQAGSAIDAIRLAPGTKQNLRKVLTAAIKPGDGSAAFDAFGIQFVGVMRNMGPDGLTPGRALRDPVEAHTLNAAMPGWHTEEAATEVREVVFDKLFPLDFYVRPPVHASTQVWVDLKWLREPKRLDTTSCSAAPAAFARYAIGGPGENDNLAVSDIYVDDMTNYVVAMALLKGSKNVQNIPKANLHAQMFVQSINTQAEKQTGVNPNLKALPFANEA